MTIYHFHHNDDVDQREAVEIDAPDKETALAEFSRRVGIELTTEEQDVISDYNYIEYGPDRLKPSWTSTPRELWIKRS